MSKAKLIKNLCRELDELGEKRELSMSDLEKVQKLSSAAKNLMKMEAMEGEGYSGAGDWEARGNYGRRGSYDMGFHEIRGEYPARSRYSRDDRGTSDRMMDYRESMADRW